MNKKLLIVIILIAIIATLTFSFSKKEKTVVKDTPLYTVKEGPLSITSIVHGTIGSSQSIPVINHVKGKSTIIWLIEEGKKVKKGELLIELDSSVWDNLKIEQEIAVTNADVAFIQSRENLKLLKKQNVEDLDNAKLSLSIAEQELEKYEKGEYVLSLNKMTADITLAKAQLEKSSDRYTWSKKLFAEGIITKMELKSDELTVQKEKLKLKETEDSLMVFKKYTHSKNISVLKNSIKKKKFELEKIEHKIKSSIVEAEAKLKAKEAELKRRKAKLELTNEQIKLCKISSPVDGMVVYTSSLRIGKKSSTGPLVEGGEVRERQELIRVPTTSVMQADIRLNELDLDKVKTGLATNVYVDVLKGKKFQGKVNKIDIMPNQQSLWANPNLKEYNTIVSLEQQSEELRQGMSCKVEILIAYFEKAIYVPVQSVIKINGKDSVYTMEEGTPVAREVITGLSNNSYVRIIKGIKPGEKVLMAPPLDSSDKTEKHNKQEFTEPENDLPNKPKQDKKKDRPKKKKNKAKKNKS